MNCIIPFNTNYRPGPRWEWHWFGVEDFDHCENCFNFFSFVEGNVLKRVANRHRTLIFVAKPGDSLMSVFTSEVRSEAKGWRPLHGILHVPAITKGHPFRSIIYASPPPNICANGMYLARLAICCGPVFAEVRGALKGVRVWTPVLAFIYCT